MRRKLGVTVLVLCEKLRQRSRWPQVLGSGPSQPNESKAMHSFIIGDLRVDFYPSTHDTNTVHNRVHLLGIDRPRKRRWEPNTNLTP